MEPRPTPTFEALLNRGRRRRERRLGIGCGAAAAVLLLLAAVAAAGLAAMYVFMGPGDKENEDSTKTDSPPKSGGFSQGGAGGMVHFYNRLEGIKQENNVRLIPVQIPSKYLNLFPDHASVWRQGRERVSPGEHRGLPGERGEERPAVRASRSQVFLF